MQMRQDRILLIVGVVASGALAAGTYLTGFGWIVSVGVLLVSAISVRA